MSEPAAPSPATSELPPLYLKVLAMHAPEECSGYGSEREAIRRRGFALAITRDASGDSKFRVFHPADWTELVALIESRPLVVGYQCIGHDLELLRSRGEVNPKKVCDLMFVYERQRGKRLSLGTAADRTVGFGASLTVKEAEDWLRKGGEKHVIFFMKQHLSAMARMHEFMIEKGWNLETTEA